MPRRKYRVQVAKAKERKERHITRLIEIYKTLHKGGIARSAPDPIVLEKFVSYHYPRLNVESQRDYAKILRSRLSSSQ
jgi:hypothetical protein